MAGDLVVLRDGRTLMGRVAEDEFSIRDEVLGEVTSVQREIAWIITMVYGHEKQDQMMLHNHTTYLGELLNTSITITILDSSPVTIPMKHVRVIRPNFLSRS